MFSSYFCFIVVYFSMGVCGAWYLSECTEVTCCESYRFRLYILLFRENSYLFFFARFPPPSPIDLEIFYY
ncbi:hypothetical protein NECAME_12202 [Necator americanus]|uniref:Uncharacterized protein n=1 Tax=Necator americanus TaxID=51031 RepID=W2T363_NECAM|nr:hypothetical protein NECAME_12202 [Necator americanus]ETN75676.1 hypothetical protein NECAME_12202 [Necator americanus]